MCDQSSVEGFLGAHAPLPPGGAFTVPAAGGRRVPGIRPLLWEGRIETWMLALPECGLRLQPCPPVQPGGPGRTGACLSQAVAGGHCCACRVGVVILHVPEHGTFLSTVFLRGQGTSRRKAMEDSVAGSVSRQLLSPLACQALTEGTLDKVLPFLGDQ